MARVEVVECDEETARRINLVDNRAAEKGSWDLDDLDDLVDLLSYLPDLDGTSYTDADVERLLAPPLSLEELADTYTAPCTLVHPEADDTGGSTSLDVCAAKRN
ncbi:hypothetical protein [Streptomyces violaceus]|uniref:ParB/Sulfiredoxin domain-containing protein n=1 Tax=Streptomyces violaceus TaxID=1936 RepID=A0ABY9ULA6_STRVL|nr:hypothetical protein [Streptomyces janthinus]WND23639.1 hypothetical protein RI060_42790 [Streptomyces janthinus]GGT01236.1 hypothetical protein GCM10010270_86210 [Streptomyces janthinus]